MKIEKNWKFSCQAETWKILVNQKTSLVHSHSSRKKNEKKTEGFILMEDYGGGAGGGGAGAAARYLHSRKD